MNWFIEANAGRRFPRRGGRSRWRRNNQSLFLGWVEAAVLVQSGWLSDSPSLTAMTAGGSGGGAGATAESGSVLGGGCSSASSISVVQARGG